jgi:hypothetical protein
MSKIGNYVIWCEEMGYTNDMGEVDSMDHVDEYMVDEDYGCVVRANLKSIAVYAETLGWNDKEDDNEMSSMQQTTK